MDAQEGRINEGRQLQEGWEDRGKKGDEGGPNEKRRGRWRSSWVHLARLMHRTGSSNGRVGHEYLINNYYRETLYFCEEKESRSPLPLFACALARPLSRRGPRTPPSLSFNLAFSLSLPSAIVPDFLLPQRHAPCRHICIFIRECNRRARFSPLVVRYHGKNSRKMAERFVVDMRSDFLLHLPSSLPAKSATLSSA